MTIDQMRFKVVTGGGNMPAYGKNLSPAEIEALVSFLETLHPANEPPAYDASRRAVEDFGESAGDTCNACRHIRPAQCDSASPMIDTTTVADLFTQLGYSVGRDLGARAHRRSFTCAAGCASAARGRRSFRPWRLATFLGGIVALFVAVASPLDTFSESLLFMHMAQHFVLMSIAPPLIVLGAPVVPMLRGLPRWFIRGCCGRSL